MDDEVAETGIAADDTAARDPEFSLFYTEQMPRLVAFLMVQGAGRALAAEVAQEAMIESYRSWDSIDHPAAWVRVVASRAWGQRVSAEPDGESRHAFLGKVRDLPAGQREVMAWAYDGYRPTEIAAQLGRDPVEVRSLLREARAALRGKYQRS
jgi:DNA-directed RNA polymerase specialized sigma24 family protein